MQTNLKSMPIEKVDLSIDSIRSIAEFNASVNDCVRKLAIEAFRDCEKYQGMYTDFFRKEHTKDQEFKILTIVTGVYTQENAPKDYPSSLFSEYVLSEFAKKLSSLVVWSFVSTEKEIERARELIKKGYELGASYRDIKKLHLCAEKNKEVSYKEYVRTILSKSGIDIAETLLKDEVKEF